MSAAERIYSKEIVRSLFKVRPAFKDIENEIIDNMTSSGAILRGHFKLESGLHSKYFFRFADYSSKLDHIDLISEKIILELSSSRLDFEAIFVQPSSGRFLAYLLSKKLNKKLIVARVDDRNLPTGEIVNEYELHPNDRVVVLEDLATTGSSLETMIAAIKKRGSKPVAMIIFATRNKEKMDAFEKEQGIPLLAVGDLLFESDTFIEMEWLNKLQNEPVLSWEI
jgi:orotate phosphoribosyltransferase